MKDAHGKELAVGDHVFIPATVSKLDEKAGVSVILDHATHDEHAAHTAAVEAWRKRPVDEADVTKFPCPSPPVATQTITLDDARHLEFHSRPASGSPIFDTLAK